MRVTIVGSGYVGLVTAACLAETGNDVVCADLNAAKIARLKANDIPIYEPGLEGLVRQNQADGRLEFTTDVGSAIERGRVIIIAVGTPHEQDGAADLSQVLAVAAEIGRHLNEPKVIVTKSTVPVGTSEKVRAEIQRHSTVPFALCSNPEFSNPGRRTIWPRRSSDSSPGGNGARRSTNRAAAVYSPIRPGRGTLLREALARRGS